MILRGLRERGFRFVPLSELMARRGDGPPIAPIPAAPVGAPMPAEPIPAARSRRSRRRPAATARPAGAAVTARAVAKPGSSARRRPSRAAGGLDRRHRAVAGARLSRRARWAVTWPGMARAGEVWVAAGRRRRARWASSSRRTVFCWAGSSRCWPSSPTRAGRGSGSALVAHVAGRVFARRRWLFVSCDADNRAALRFYRRQGFARVGRLPDLVRAGRIELLLRKPSSGEQP